ncbi:MAG TPA: hypothetical protein VKZ53_00200 [Candidatus Angelobacter sp.]|nr:hypothetical protein [Candidatus Angelobacter sp.]
MTLTLTIFVAITAVAFSAQAIILYFLYKAIDRSSMRMEGILGRMEQRTEPILSAAESILDDAQPKVSEITNNLAESSAIIRAHVSQMTEATGEIVERARTQAARLDDLISSTAYKIEATTDFLQNTVVTPVRRIHAIVSAVNTGLKFLRRHRVRPKATDGAAEPEHDEEMFI